MNKGCDLNSKSGITQAPALFSAITRRRMAVAAVLLNAGADIHATDSNGNNALHVAALNGNFEAVQMLIEASYQQHPNRITRSTYFSSFNLYDLTPAMMAATRGHTPIIQLLFNAGANPLIRNRQGFSANDFLPRMVPMYLVPIPTFYWQPM
jgi:ankyrin repeat protein